MTIKSFVSLLMFSTLIFPSKTVMFLLGQQSYDLSYKSHSVQESAKGQVQENPSNGQLDELEKDRGETVNLDSSSSQILNVPGDGYTLQQAINLIDDGGIIELAGGTFISPVGGFKANDAGKGFTIRSVPGATVILDGESSHPIFLFQNSDPTNGGHIIFEGLVFSNGFSSTDGLAGGVTLYSASATFINCQFQSNQGDQSGTGGGAFLSSNSRVLFIDTLWSSNSAKNFGGGLVVADGSSVQIHNSQFSDNRTNFPYHAASSAGGAIHVGNSDLYVSNTRFQGNEAGYVGGAVYVIGIWQSPIEEPRSEVIITNSTFENNRALRDPSVTSPFPTEGGAIHIEDQAQAKIFNSRFFKNSAMIGGAINQYRSVVEVHESILIGNVANGTGASNGFGGTISAHSNDTSADGTNNRPSAFLYVGNSLIQGRTDGVTTVGQSGGGIAIGGDSNRVYGQNGVSMMGTLSENRAQALIENVVFFDVDVLEAGGVPGSGTGGAFQSGLSSVAIHSSLFLNSDAIGTGAGSGGAISLLDQSVLNLDNSSFINNSAGVYGGAIFLQGSMMNALNCSFVSNEVSPGISEDLYNSYGSAIFASVDSGRDHPAEGIVEDCVFSENVGLEIYDDDRSDGPINDLIYNSNQFYSTSFGSLIYRNSIPSPIEDASGLNGLVISRNNGTTTDKSTENNNIDLVSVPLTGRLLAVAPHLLSTQAAGDPPGLAQVYLAYAWSGEEATLDGDPLGSNGGLLPSSSSGLYILSVDGNQFSQTVSAAPVPEISLSPSSMLISPGDPASLGWTVYSGSYLGVAMDQKVEIIVGPTGSVVVSPLSSRRYHIYAITEEGGAADSSWVGVWDTIFRIFLPLITR